VQKLEVCTYHIDRIVVRICIGLLGRVSDLFFF
jgi:hypothetical protein